MCVCVRWTVPLPYDDWWAPEDQPVIVLADLADGHQGFQVLVRLVGVDVVEGAAVPGIPVGSCEVYGHLRHTHTYTHTDERVCHRRGKYNNKQTNKKKARGDSLWTESGSLPWCNQERNTFWWPDGGRNCRKTLDWIWERRNELCVAGSWRVALVCLGIYGRLKKQRRIRSEILSFLSFCFVIVCSEMNIFDATRMWNNWKVLRHLQLGQCKFAASKHIPFSILFFF